MNVFIIPSWYPHAAAPIAGIFVKEQAEALADMAEDLRVLVSTWGQDLGFLHHRNLRKFWRAAVWFARAKSNRISEVGGVLEIFNPLLAWSGRLPFGGMRRLIAVNRKNLRLAVKHYGPINLIHAHVSYPAGYVAKVLSTEFQIPYVLTEHMSPFPFPDLQRNGQPIPEIASAFRGAAATIAVSPSLVQTIASFGYAAPSFVPNLVDERRFFPAPPTKGKFIFFTLGALVEQKGIDLLLRSIAQWNPHAAEVEFRIGGEGPMRERYEALAHQLGLADRVRWLGAVGREEAPQHFRECHAYVMPSRHETFGVVFAEAIASGKPIIATRCGGPECIVNAENGRLVDVGDVVGLAATMQDMFRNWSQYDAQAIRADFLQRFSRAAVVKQLLHLYRGVQRAG